MRSPDPKGLAEHWGRIIGIAVSDGADGAAELRLPNSTFSFVKGPAEIMSALSFRVADVAAVCDAAKARGYAVSDNAFALGGVDFRLVS
jgi:hypothetical protein